MIEIDKKYNKEINKNTYEVNESITKLKIDITSLQYDCKILKVDKEVSKLDFGTNDEDDDEMEIKKDLWTINDGVTPDMLQKICQILNISHYAFDISRKCFLKHLATSRNYPALVYYAVGNHMYHINNRKDVDSLTKSC